MECQMLLCYTHPVKVKRHGGSLQSRRHCCPTLSSICKPLRDAPRHYNGIRLRDASKRMNEARKITPGPDLLDDLCSRFILNVPASELESFEKLMFLVEQAHWFYEDFCREKNPTLKSLSLKEFTSLLFGHCPGLGPFQHLLDSIYTNFNKFKQTVPTMGAILLNNNMDKVLLVRGFHTSDGWGFPKGKVAMSETDHDCAIREVMEETGFDISSRLIKSDFIEVHMGQDGLRQQRSKLYIVRGVDENTCFLPTVKGEIGAFAWHIIEHLPSTGEATRQVWLNAEGGRHRFFMVYPFVKQLKAWIKREKRKGNGNKIRAAKSGVTPRQNGNEGPVAVNKETQPGNEPSKLPSSKPLEPGQPWINFKFCREEILKHFVI